MIDNILRFKNKELIVFLPVSHEYLKSSLEETFKNIVIFGEGAEKKNVAETINNSKIKNVYLIGNDNIYRYILPRLKKSIKVCWIFPDSFSSLSDGKKRYELTTIMEYMDRKLINSIGCVNRDNYTVLSNAGYEVEFIDLKVKKEKKKNDYNNTIGLLSNDFDPNNNYYNELASLTFIEYDSCKVFYIMPETKRFISKFNLKCKRYDSIDEVIRDNFVNLYINFTNTDATIIKRSFELGVPCIVGNTNYFDNNKYLKENLVVKSDDDVREIAKKIEFVRDNREKILEEYNKLECL